ncbi:TPR-like protein [Rhizophagus irregularis]|uniref:TPR-like protein n=1 Tax=Rhizophagus irregularis TaxID=588596 RepID=A0A2I1GL08_9GLOM|nr:TPR-like protein [Rhizophagus irregularis]
MYENESNYSKALEILDKLLNINMNDSLILCYCGENLCNMEQYSKAILYFTKANIIDPENTHNLNKRAIAYYILQDYNKVLLDLDKVIQLDPLNSLAYYFKSLTYYTKKDINNAVIVFKKYKELFDFNDILAKTQLFHLKYLLNRNNSTELNSILTEINQISNIDGRCNVDFWSLSRVVDKDLFELGIINGFSKYMYKRSYVYSISNLGSDQQEHILKHKNVLKIVGLGWIEYQLPINIYGYEIQLSIEINGFINMQIDYVRFDDSNKEMITCIPNMGDLLPNFHKICPNVPETFKDKYFSRKEMENLLELKDIINNLK